MTPEDIKLSRQMRELARVSLQNHNDRNLRKKVCSCGNGFYTVKYEQLCEICRQFNGEHSE